MTQEHQDEKAGKKQKPNLDTHGKFRNHFRQNSKGIPDSDILLPETVRNREIAEKVDALMKSGGFKGRRAARKHLGKNSR